MNIFKRHVCCFMSVFALSTVLFSRAEKPENLRPVEYNLKKLVKQAAIGFIAPPVLFGQDGNPMEVDPDGKVHAVPSMGSITYNFRTGDSAYDLAGEHIEPAVSLYNLGVSRSRTSPESFSLNVLSCIGNSVRVISGEAKGAEGIVVGKHGGIEHVMVDFADGSVFEKLIIGDMMQVYTCGLGLELENVEGVRAINVSPFLMEALTKAGMGVTQEGKLRLPVALIVPAKIMGAGLGANHTYKGDYDIQLFDDKVIKEFNLDKIRFGDLVAILDADHSFGRIYRTGAVTVGAVVHSSSHVAGHGPGVTTLFTSAEGNIEVVRDRQANLAFLFGLK